MKSRIVIVVLLVLFSVFYTELRMRSMLKINSSIMEVVTSQNDTNLTQTETDVFILKTVKILQENINVLLEDFYYEGKQ